MIAAASIYVLDQTNGTIISSGQKREYLLYVPKSYDLTKATSLVISMHGAAGWPAQQMNLSQWNRLADENGFIVVYPSGSGVPKIWHVDRSAGLMRDVRFIAELIDTLRAKPLPEWWVGPTSNSIDATNQMWTFFRDHRLRRK